MPSRNRLVNLSVPTGGQDFPSRAAAVGLSRAETTEVYSRDVSEKKKQIGKLD